MTVEAWLTLTGIVLSPIVAVSITLWIEGRRRKRDSQMHVVRLLMATRHLPSDPSYSTAVNLIPVEFAAHPKVIAAHKEYHRAIRREAPLTPEGHANANLELAQTQTKLISAVLSAVGMNVSEADLAAEAYAASGFIARDNLWLDSLRAQVRTAEALEKSLDR